MLTMKKNIYLNFKDIDFRIFSSLICLFFLSNFYFVTFESSSLAQGLLASAIVVSGLSYKKGLFFGFGLKKTSAFLGGVFLLLLISLVVFALSGNLKSLTAIALIPLMFASLCFAQRIATTNTNKILHTFFVFLILLIIFGWLGLLGVTQYGNYLRAAKGFPPFSEQSHYALSVGLIAVAYTFSASKKEFIFIFINLLAQALLLPNLTLLVFCALSAFAFSLRFRSKYYIIFLPPFLITTVWASFIFISEVDYFSNRLSFQDSTNVTTLVWIQGWELAHKTFFDTGGLGVGLQMLGLDESQLTEASYKIQNIAGRALNIEDGGFLASKIISETGAMGFAIVLLYILSICKFIKNMAWTNKSLKSGGGVNDSSRRRAFLGGMLFAFIVEMFFRGYGYFSPGLFLVFSAWLADKISKSKNPLHPHIAGLNTPKLS
ncbi:putative membrane protein [Pseudomonas fluorescens]|uniref:Putative membrane protein n=1 Tax=Pseudomonas fluorescens TaxID=294 RepID=A0A0P8X0I0_PSEFL|nr:hypothetical protein [Pseudomonas fluorescens]KPU53063.1 putative membrane protein [Pseudomonas fluorescens]